ncbi:hypothetical protein VDG1235_3579 [Verrucomicrobiia bacterium DG1235]|nr:hypothetical protein VDG1235_3579 [Verrucomicrobiae bacterium DG1235]
MRGDGQLAAFDAVRSRSSPSRLGQPGALENRANGAGRRRRLDAVLGLQDHSKLLWSPSPVQASFIDDEPLHLGVGRVGADERPAAPLRQPRRSEFSETRHVLVPGFAADPELDAQVGYVELAATGKVDESEFLIHRRLLYPGHSPEYKCYLCPRSNCYRCLRSVPVPSLLSLIFMGSL